MVLFKIGDLDITPFMVAGSYKVSRQPEYEEWKDGYSNERRGMKGWRLRGNFSLLFFDRKDYQDFLTTVENAVQPGGYLYATVYDNKTRNVMTTNMFFDYDPANIEPLIGFSGCEQINISVSSRSVIPMYINTT